MTRTRRGASTTVLLGAGQRIQTADARALTAPTASQRPGDDWETVWARTIREKAFQAIVVASLRSRAWRVWVVPDMRRTTAGLPDLVCVHPDIPIALFWECKTQRGRVRPEQVTALRALAAVPGIDARIVRPAGWRELRDWLDDGLPSPDPERGFDD